MSEKLYKTITEVSELLNINKHVIRYWDSKFDGISTRLSVNKRRFFNNDNIKKLHELKKILYKNGKHNYSLDLANSIINKKDHNKAYKKHKINNAKDNNNLYVSELKIISNNLKKLLES